MAVTFNLSDSILITDATSLAALSKLKETTKTLQEKTNNARFNIITGDYNNSNLNNYKKSIAGLFTTDQLAALKTFSEKYTIGTEKKDINTIISNLDDANELIAYMERDRLATEIKNMDNNYAQCLKELETLNENINTAKNNYNSILNNIKKIEDKVEEYKEKISNIVMPQKNLEELEEEKATLLKEYNNLIKYGAKQKIAEERSKNNNELKDRKLIELNEKILDYEDRINDIQENLNRYQSVSLYKDYIELVLNGDTNPESQETLQELDIDSNETQEIINELIAIYRNRIDIQNLINENINVIQNNIKQYQKNNNITAYKIAKIRIDSLYAKIQLANQNKSYAEIANPNYTIKGALNDGGADNRRLSALTKLLEDATKNNKQLTDVLYTPMPLSALRKEAEELWARIENMEKNIDEKNNCLSNNLSDELKKKYIEVKKKVDVYESKKPKKSIETQEYNNISKNPYSSTVVNEDTVKHTINRSNNIIYIEGNETYSRDTRLGKRIGYTLLECGNYTENMYKKNNSIDGPNTVTFVLPLPEGSVDFNTSVNWSEESENGLNEAAFKFTNGTATNIGDLALKGFKKHRLGRAHNNLSDTFMRGAERGMGIAYNPNNQLYFDNVELDSFDYSFQLVPKSKEEANNIQIIIKLINMLILPGASEDTNIFKNLTEVLNRGTESITKDFKNKGKSIDSILSGGVTKLISLTSSGLSAFMNYVTGEGYGDLAAPFFSYPGLWNAEIHLTKNNGTEDFLLLRRKKLAMTSCKLEFGSSNGLTWHDDGYPTVMNMSVSFQETQYRTKDTYTSLVEVLNAGAYNDVQQKMAQMDKIKINEQPTISNANDGQNNPTNIS